MGFDTRNPASVARGGASEMDHAGSLIYSEDSRTEVKKQRGGKRSREKGNRAERTIVRFLQEKGFAAERVPLSGAVGGSYVGDLTVPLIGRDLVAEVKARRGGFGQLYKWLDGCDLLIVKADRREALVILPIELAAEIGMAAEVAKKVLP